MLSAAKQKNKTKLCTTATVKDFIKLKSNVRVIIAHFLNINGMLHLTKCLNELHEYHGKLLDYSRHKFLKLISEYSYGIDVFNFNALQMQLLKGILKLREKEDYYFENGNKKLKDYLRQHGYITL